MRFDKKCKFHLQTLYLLVLHPQKLVQFQKMIDYIRNDEQTHVVLFTKLIHETFDTYKERGMIYDIMGAAAEQEIQWSQETYGDRILGISKESSKQYVQYLTNQRLPFQLRTKF